MANKQEQIRFILKDIIKMVEETGGLSAAAEEKKESKDEKFKCIIAEYKAILQEVLNYFSAKDSKINTKHPVFNPIVKSVEDVLSKEAWSGSVLVVKNLISQLEKAKESFNQDKLSGNPNAPVQLARVDAWISPTVKGSIQELLSKLENLESEN